MTGDDGADEPGGEAAAPTASDDAPPADADVSGETNDDPETNVIDRINEINVEQKLQDLGAEFDDVDVTVEEFELGAGAYADVFAATDRTGYDGNSVVFLTRDGADLPPLSDALPEQAERDTRDRVLMVLGRGADLWALPGGGQSQEYESMQGTTLRRVNEQTGVRCTIADIEEVFHRKYYPETDAEGSVHTLDVYFRGEYASGSIDVDESELVGAAWFADPPERMTEGAKRIWESFLAERGRADELDGVTTDADLEVGDPSGD
ncbi:NUDIX domain-containing protein [Haloarcula litorea]|uniref:NUDIX domain-containing protein n=1 Tax=Haloarcula litorea TaxID=3032579 RepID=UPI0023E8D0B7|nr:NUDIX domain-containing protein [Halomicroarcula sp. GDY20]